MPHSIGRLSAAALSHHRLSLAVLSCPSLAVLRRARARSRDPLAGDRLSTVAPAGLEAGPLSQWLFSALAEAGLPVICVDVHSADRWKDVLEAVWPAIGVNSRAAASAPMSCCLFAANVVRLQLCETGFPTKSGSSARAAFE